VECVGVVLQGMHYPGVDRLQLRGFGLYLLVGEGIKIYQL